MPIKPKKIEVGHGSFVSGPLVTSDAIYAAVKDDVTVRFDRRTLRKVWEVDSQNFRLGAAIDDAFLTVGGRPPSDGGVRSADDGRLLWSTFTRFSGVGVWQGRAVVDSKLGLELREAASGEIHRMYEVPRGYEEWNLTSGDMAILQQGRTVKRFNLTVGDMRWERPLVDELEDRLSSRTESAAVKMTVASRSKALIAFHGGSTFGVSADDGSILWHAAVWSPYSWPAAHEGRVYALCLDRFRAIDEKTGTIVYDLAHPELKDAFRDKTGTIYKERMAVANESGHLAIFNLADGALVSVYQSKVPLWRTAEADGRLLVATEYGTLLVFDESIWGL